jgi:hypothetical protein
MALALADLSAIAGFVPQRVLKQGGQGTAVLGERGGHEVVVKVLDPVQFNPVAWKHALAASTVSHANLVPVESADSIDIGGVTYHYVVMPYIAGETVRDALVRGRRWTVDEAVGHAAQAAEGLAALHSVNRLHRDVKPENLQLRASDDAVVLLDFDLVYYGEFATATGRHMRTAGYAAPEHDLRNQFSIRSDLFALGLVLLEMLVGRHPFAASSWPEVQDRINRADGPDPLPPTVPGDVADLVRRLLSPRPADRPASAVSVAADLRAHRRTPRKLLGDIALGGRLGRQEPIRRNLQRGRLDLVVAEANQLPAGFNAAGWRSSDGVLLIDPRTDLVAAGHASDRLRKHTVDWGWEPQPVVDALSSAVDDDLLATSLLAWQAGLGADGLIAPYLRTDRWGAAGHEDIERIAALSAAATRVARTRWPDMPLFAAVAIPRGTFADTARRDQVLEVLTDGDVDGAYVVVEAPASNLSAHYVALREFGETLRSHGRTAILAYAGGELLPLLAAGSWDAVVTGPAQSQRAPRFTNHPVLPRELDTPGGLEGYAKRILARQSQHRCSPRHGAPARVWHEQVERLDRAALRIRAVLGTRYISSERTVTKTEVNGVERVNHLLVGISSVEETR